MEDVLLTYLRSRDRGQPPPGPAASAAAASAADAGVTATLTAGEDPFLKSTLPFPLGPLMALVDAHKDYPSSCQQVADFFKKLSGQYRPGEVIHSLLQTRLSRVWTERFLFILLEVQPSDWQTAAYALQFRHLRRLLLRVERGQPINGSESMLARGLIQALHLTSTADLDAPFRLAMECFRALQASYPVASGDQALVIYLIRCEVAAMGERKNWLEGELTGSEPEAVARLSPHLKLLEDRMHKAHELAQRLAANGDVQDAPMGLEEAMGPFFFAYFHDSVAKEPALAPLRRALDLQQSKRVPTRDLIGLSTLCRWHMEAKGESAAGPMDWVCSALEAYDRGHFRLQVGAGMPALESLLGEARLERDGSLVSGNFGENPYSSWISRDCLTRPFRSLNPERIAADMRTTVLANIHRETIILKLLDNARVYEAAGMVELIVESSRSPTVHSKIATRKELHSGSANARVPLALLKSPVSIPTALLRTLIHPSHVSMTELKALFRARSSLRSEVSHELGTFLKQARAI